MISTRDHLRPIHPLHAIFLAFPFPLFLAALLSDVAYAATFHVQWINFASWLIAGGLLIGACALVWALIEVRRNGRGLTWRPISYGLALVGDAIYVANQDSLVRFDYREGQTQASGPPTRITELPSAINH